MKAYIASPFFNEKQLSDTMAVEEACKSAGWDFYSPRLGTISKEYGNLNETSDPYQVYLYKTMVFAEDIQEIDTSDVVMVNYDNKDSGTLFELGYALALNKMVLCSSRDPEVRKEFKELLDIIKRDIICKYQGPKPLITIKGDKLEIGEHTQDNTIVVVAEHDGSRYLGLSKALLGFLYRCSCKIIYVDVPRKSNLMLTSSVNVYECSDLSIFDSDATIEEKLAHCTPVDETTKDE